MKTDEGQLETLSKYFYNGIYTSPSRFDAKFALGSLLDMSNSEEETIKVDMEGELISALEELKKSRKKNKYLKKQLLKIEEHVKEEKDFQ